MTENIDESSCIDLQQCQTLLDNYKASLQQRRQSQQAESTEQNLSSDAHDVSPAAGDGVVEHNDETPGTNPATAAATAAESQKYVDWETMQQMSEAAAVNGADSALNQQPAAAVVSDVDPLSSTTDTDQPVYASVKKFDRSLQLQTTDDGGDCDAETEDGGVRHPTYAVAMRVNGSRADHPTQDNRGYTRLIHVTSEGVATPIRFVVRLVGSVPMSAEDRDACSSCEFVERHVRRLCGRQHAGAAAAETPSDVVYYWPTDVDITLELSGKYLRLVDSSNDSELFSQRLHSVKQWSTGPGKNSHHFAFMSPEPAGERFACHVFRCCGDYCAKDITSTLRNICGQMLQLKEQLATKM